MSSYALAVPRFRAAKRTKRGVGGPRHFELIVTGGKLDMTDERGVRWAGVWVVFGPKRPFWTTLTHEPTGATVDAKIVSIYPWWAWRPVRVRCVTAASAGRRFLAEVNGE